MSKLNEIEFFHRRVVNPLTLESMKGLNFVSVYIYFSPEARLVGK